MNLQGNMKLYLTVNLNPEIADVYEAKIKVGFKI
jgi:hypothetical protein